MGKRKNPEVVLRDEDLIKLAKRKLGFVIDANFIKTEFNGGYAFVSSRRTRGVNFYCPNGTADSQDYVEMAEGVMRTYREVRREISRRFVDNLQRIAGFSWEAGRKR